MADSYDDLIRALFSGPNAYLLNGVLPPESSTPANTGPSAADAIQAALAGYGNGASAAVNSNNAAADAAIGSATTAAGNITAGADGALASIGTLLTPPTDNIAAYLAAIGQNNGMGGGPTGQGPNGNPNVGTDIEGAVNGMMGANPTNRDGDTTYSGSTAPYYDGNGNLTAAGNGQQYMQWIGSLMGGGGSGGGADPVAAAKAATDAVFAQGQAATGSGGGGAAPAKPAAVDPMSSFTTAMAAMQKQYADAISAQQASYKAEQERIRKEALNRGQAPRDPKSIKTSADKNRAIGGAGITSTMLTGAAGIDPTSLTLGKNTLLGA